MRNGAGKSTTIRMILGLAPPTVGAENLCHQAIFMDHTSGAFAPPNAEVIQVGDAIRQRTERRGLVSAENSVTSCGLEYS
jgi:ABC-type Mn2+/Zn2+ transport system ATPase subunit